MVFNEMLFMGVTSLFSVRMSERARLLCKEAGYDFETEK